MTPCFCLITAHVSASMLVSAEIRPLGCSRLLIFNELQIDAMIGLRELKTEREVNIQYKRVPNGTRLYCTPTTTACGAFRYSKYFGPENPKSPGDKHAGAAFFRLCGGYREKNPFLILDYEQRSYVLDFGPESTSETGVLLSDSIDPTTFYDQVKTWRGPCFTFEDGKPS